MPKKKGKKKGKKVPAGMHMMPSGKMMKDSEMDAMMKEEPGMKKRYMEKKKMGKYKK